MLDLTGFQSFAFTTGRKTMTVARYGVRFSKAAVLQLGMPEYVNVLINYDKKQFVLKVTNAGDPQKVQFLNSKKKRKEVQ